MKILALESSAVAASVALCEDDQLIAQAFQNTGLTHSQTLLPLAEDLLKNCGLTMADMDLIAVAEGPGSFTGLRIGVAAAKGLAWGGELPCAGCSTLESSAVAASVALCEDDQLIAQAFQNTGLAWGGELPCAGCSTLESMAWNLAGFEGEVCAAMDARRKQVYNARFRVDGQQPHRLTPDRAISLEDLAAELQGTEITQIIVGDGAKLCYEALTAAGIPAVLAPPNLRMQSAWGVARLALEKARNGQTITANELAPVYHRLSQAERERLERENQNP